MLYEFNVYQTEANGHVFWVAESKALKGCVGQGENFIDAIRELEENEQEWLKTAKEFNIPIPARTLKSQKSYSGKIALRVSPLVHQNAAAAAADLDISLNQFINDAVISYTSEVHKHI